jgi:hypothetical protein
MTDKDFNKIARSDIGDLLVHWTRKKITANQTTSAFSILKKIIREKTIRGGHGYIRGNYDCVCFTESPISDLVKVFSLAKMNEDRARRQRYEPYGIGIKKSWLFDKGGRPVIYSSSDEYNDLTETMRWRYVNYNPPSMDFTWEREWRIKVDTIELDPEQTVIIVPTRTHIGQMEDLLNNEWLVMPLSILGLPSDWID